MTGTMKTLSGLMMPVAAVVVALLAVAGCRSQPPAGADASATPGAPARVSCIRDSDEPLPVPRVTAAIVGGNVDGIMDWDRAHNQFLTELLHTGLFVSVALEPADLVDYGATFSISGLPGNAMQVQLTFVNMHTGETVYSCVTTGNRRNGHFGFAFIQDTGTSYDDALEMQCGLARAIAGYTVTADGIPGRLVAVLQPHIDGSGLPPDDKEAADAFHSYARGKLVPVVENFLARLAGAQTVDRASVDRVARETGLTADEPPGREATGTVGRLLGADYVMTSTVAYDPDGNFLIRLDLVDVRTGTTSRSTLFEANMWGDEAAAFDVGTHIDQMFHTRGPAAEMAAAGELPRADRPGVDVLIRPIFPVFYSYYDRNPIGTATLTNPGGAAFHDLVLSFYIAQYMDNPKFAAPVPRLEPGDSITIPVHGLFTSRIMEVTEGARLSALVRLEYLAGETERSLELVQSVQVLNRNALTWDDDRKLAAFVTARDPVVMGFARNVSGVTQEAMPSGVNDALAVAAGLHEALDEYGVRYVPDPVTAYAEYSQQQNAIDHVLFPRQTLEYRGGDCDDLTALYCALLESVGVETAFITIPGHIYAAVSLGPEEAARRAFANPEELVFADGRAWLPVEVTLRAQGFLPAWREGAKEWRVHAATGTARLHPVHAAWEFYPPVGLPGSGTPATVDGTPLGLAIASELGRLVEREITASRAQIQALAAAAPDDPRWPNRLGILYGRYGNPETALRYFQEALQLRRDYVPALLNIGNVHFQSGDYAAALNFYRSAAAIRPDRPDVLLSIARANHELENYAEARAAFQKLREQAPDVAASFAYLALQGEEASRAARAGGAARAGDAGGVIWVEAEGAEDDGGDPSAEPR